MVVGAADLTGNKIFLLASRKERMKNIWGMYFGMPNAYDVKTVARQVVDKL